ncbi:choloylglycine hydrolase [Vagococcus sp. JNUCC 83]
MCTSVSFNGNHHFFGRNLDLHYTFNQEVVITPRHYPFNFRNGLTISNHYAIIGMGLIVDDTPLYFDATNEKGLSMAGLNYPKNAHFAPLNHSDEHITTFEFIPYLLSQCGTVEEAKRLLSDLTITEEPFSKDMPNSPLHWMLSDSVSSLTIESDEDGLHVYDNPVGVLTNNPPFPKQLFNLNNYRHLTTKTPDNTFSSHLSLDDYSNGLGGLGLPGDLSSMSRFVRASFTKENCLIGDTVEEDILQFFHILSSVEQTKGLCDVGNSQFEYTIYSSCCDTTTGSYYYKTYNNTQINGVHLFNEALDTTELIHYPLVMNSTIQSVN